MGVMVESPQPARRRAHPVSHPAVEAPLCESCQQMELAFFDPSCPGCRQILDCPSTPVAAVFAILRQWVPQTQRSVEMLVDQVLRRGAHVDDRDSLTDMTLLQYACKAGASGVGDAEAASRAVNRLLQLGACARRRCRWTTMTALHYAAFFDVAPALLLLLDFCKGCNIEERCSEYDNGSALHLAASNLCLEAVKVLMQRGANPTVRDAKGRTALQCVPNAESFILVPNVQEAIGQLRSLLCLPSPQGPRVKGIISAKATLCGMHLSLGQRVLVAGTKSGVLRYCGATKFAAGVWAGVELDTPDGKHDGTVQGVTYFQCAPQHGIMAPLSRISKVRSTSLPFSNIGGANPPSLRVGQHVKVRGNRSGTIRFIGDVHFSVGRWVGVELDFPSGHHDGTVRGVRYFHCRPKHGLLVSIRVLSSTPASVNGRRTPSLYANGKQNSLFPNNQRRSSSLSTNGRQTPLSFLSTNDSRSWVQEGTTVLYKREVCTVRFVGTVHFAEGTWLGLEMRGKTGRHDGVVQGRRYFHCREGHGVMVRPRAVTVHGINGAVLVPS